MIRKASINDAALLSKIGVASFLPAHGHSAPKEIIDDYISEYFSEENLKKELEEEDSYFFLLYHEESLVGYSKIILNHSESSINVKNAAYMSRLYLLKEYYNLGLGQRLFHHAVSFCKSKNQKAIWLKVWIENHKAIAFYHKMGFQQIGLSDFRLSETHSNPNYILSLDLK